jgi:hypothetical protein
VELLVQPHHAAIPTANASSLPIATLTRALSEAPAEALAKAPPDTVERKKGPF